MLNVKEYRGYTCEGAHENARRHGFYQAYDAIDEILIDKDEIDLAAAHHRDFVLSQLAKICSEVGEAVHCVQKNAQMGGLGEELADIVIRTMDLCGFLDINLDQEIHDKAEKNRSRPYLHGKTC